MFIRLIISRPIHSRTLLYIYILYILPQSCIGGGMRHAPLRHTQEWTKVQAAPVLSALNVPLYQVDAHNIVPVWMESLKREVGARTLRSKINRVFGEYCTHFPKFDGNAHLKEEEGLGLLSKKKENIGHHDWD